MNHRGKFEVSAGLVVLLGGATFAASVIVFLLGVYVGKGMVEQRLAQESRVVRLPVPTPGASLKSGEDDVTFWGKLRGTPSSSTPEAVPATQTEAAIRIAPPAPTAAPAEERAAPTPAPTRPAAAARPAPTRAPARAPAAPPIAVEGGSAAVQVNAMGDKGRAEALVKDLAGLGYTAYLSPAKVGGTTLYRVRVGGLGGEEAAKQALGKLRELGYPKAFLVVETSER